MSVEAMGTCWGSQFPTDGCENTHPSTVRLVALAVADVVNDLHGNEFYGKLSTLAEKVELHRNTVRRVVRHLCDVGVLEVLKPGAPGVTTPGIYRWIWTRPESVDNSETPDQRSRRLRDLSSGVTTKSLVEGRADCATGRADVRDQVAHCSATYTNRTQLNIAGAREICEDCDGTLFVTHEEVGTYRGDPDHVETVYVSEPCPRCHPKARRP